MIENTKHSIPDGHPIREIFQQLTRRGMNQLHLDDPETIDYVTNLLVDFVHLENLYRVRDGSGQRLEYVCDILEQSAQNMEPSVRRECYRHLGDMILFRLGLFPEALNYGRRSISPAYYAEQGRRSYTIVAQMEETAANALYWKLSERFPQYVVGLNWVKRYISDPFYQYMFRQYEIV